MHVHKTQCCQQYRGYKRIQKENVHCLESFESLLCVGVILQYMISKGMFTSSKKKKKTPHTHKHSRVSIFILPGGSDVVHPAEQHPGLLQLDGIHRRTEKRCGVTGSQEWPGRGHSGIFDCHLALLLKGMQDITWANNMHLNRQIQHVSREDFSYVGLIHRISESQDLLLLWAIFGCHWEVVGCSVAGSWMAGVVTECWLWRWRPLLIAHCHVWEAAWCT